MTLPIYQQTRRDVPCEWLCDDEQDEPKPPSQWDTYIGYIWAAALVALIIGPAALAMLGGQP
ncbi:hypothetical protein [Rhodococcus rhodochrous]|uniref:hypothetical protein n=1 Tax=Rhodococcus rhodochrous TaxID=1829 RepID=UPI001E2EBD95|nr:hypothetical protein [Rhodococcus rhodochrous]MCD2096567.1 hypothetical protein [Rhodococcus rhodochrous]MCD2121215.1 hypothetical protein [Rhodococcus rhodochrous]MCQ4137308.1 hypothetical protein [Rhodococcus rhodochrous]MDJ0021199.1 hypothetical protein [Rhodococcus rhodochrous]